MRCRCMGANGTVIANAKSKIAATASANRRCLGVGGKVANDTSGSSDASPTAKKLPPLSERRNFPTAANMPS
jgi:hypothetical protein